MFNSVDAVSNDRFVFDIRGNSYRIVAMIFFNVRTVYIRFVGLIKNMTGLIVPQYNNWAPRTTWGKG